MVTCDSSESISTSHVRVFFGFFYSRLKDFNFGHSIQFCDNFIYEFNYVSNDQTKKAPEKSEAKSSIYLYIILVRKSGCVLRRVSSSLHCPF